jgi:hypothetical protein
LAANGLNYSASRPPENAAKLRPLRNIVAHGYAAVYQDTRGRHGAEGEDRVYADDAADGRDTLDWIASQALVQSDGGHVGLVRRRYDDVRRGLDPTSDVARVFRSGWRLQHL